MVVASAFLNGKTDTSPQSGVTKDLTPKHFRIADPNDRDLIGAVIQSIVLTDGITKEEVLRSVVDLAIYGRDFYQLDSSKLRKRSVAGLPPTPLHSFFSSSPNFPFDAKLTLRSLGTLLFFDKNGELVKLYGRFSFEQQIDSLVNLFINVRRLYDGARVSTSQPSSILEELNTKREAEIAISREFYESLKGRCEVEMATLPEEILLALHKAED